MGQQDSGLSLSTHTMKYDISPPVVKTVVTVVPLTNEACYG